VLLGVDVGGTFTDAVLVEGRAVWTGKVPSTPVDPALGVFAAVDAVLRSAGRPPGAITRFAHGMTVATNALLEGHFARTALVATDGFVDLVELARQARANLYRLCEHGPTPLAPRELRFGAPERALPTGVLEPLDRLRTAEMLEALAQAEPQAVAVVLLHSFAHPEHEHALGELIAARLPGVHVTLSHELVGTFREYERAATTEVDAALSPLVAGYLGELAARAGGAGLPEPAVMQSSGGLIEAGRAAAHAALTVLSGPAGGVGGARLLAALAGEQDVLCFDMGGTSCDVCVIRGGEVSETSERAVAGRPLALPALDIHTVGAGGGSIAWRDPGGALRVGPQSAGAVPGPACYGRGGEAPTVTDANLVLGRLPADATLGGAVELDADAARRAVGALARELGLGLEECAAGIVRVAEAEMLRALRVMTIERGIDPRGFALMGFGGAGPLHAAAMAQELGVTRVLCPRASGVLSALGLAAAPARRDVSRTVMLGADGNTDERLAVEREGLLGRARAELAAPEDEEVNARVRYELRYAGQSFELPVEVEEPATFAALAEAFNAAHEQRYGYRDERGEVELVTMRVSAWIAPPAPSPAGETDAPPQRRRARAVLEGAETEVEWLIGSLSAGTAIDGPALCALPEATLLVPPGWRGDVDDHGTVTLSHADDARRGRARGTGGAEPATRPGAGSRASLDPVELQVLSGALRAACEEMGAVLIRSAHSANIKERRDASTALFDADGQMVMQAEHIPVHLGAMPDAVAAILARDQREGCSFILNDPFAGGTHLPDITIITPVFAETTLIGFAASRAHHADVGGRWPGSMPADSRTLAEEGVVIAPQPVSEALLEQLVQQMRQPAERMADLRAQLAANRVGALRLAELARRFGVGPLRAATDSVLDYAERRTRACLDELAEDMPGEPQAEDVLEAEEGDLALRLRARIERGALVLDFSDSAPQHAGNLNCPLSVTRSACYFAVRVLTDPDIPPSAGAYRPIEVRVPEGCLLNARPGAAVAAGNVETSSRVADLVMAAFGRALGQGTMNNLTLGDDRFSYYETIGGGQGACADADGPSAVHVAMSNTLNTPIEALERDFPLRVRRYAVRRDSGGAGARGGGDGVVRELEALAPMAYSLITERRRHAPPGAGGGGEGARGRNLLIDDRGEAGELPPKCSGTLSAGERLRIETPGGGGYGASRREAHDIDALADQPKVVAS
jgi:N-methylhydantoinase A/oxoprolinase/acetone carboxylase beta subunit/N-methylhydantoinase B/oxoprolinase/acetone carboxylase alpha subunit